MSGFGSASFGSSSFGGGGDASSKIVEFTGQISRDVLGGGLFSTDEQMMLRGYADLRDLASISEPYLFNSSKGEGYQREIIESHAEELKKYFESSVGYKFVPEVVLSIRKPSKSVSINLSKPTKARPYWKLKIDLSKIEGDGVKVYRIDGNHRLHYAEKLDKNPVPPTKYIVSFCILILGDSTDSSDDVTEAMIFHNINSKAVPIDSEHAFNVLLSCEEDENKLFENDPKLFATKVFKEIVCSWHDKSITDLFGDNIYSRAYQLIEFIKKEGIIDFKMLKDLRGSVSQKAEDMKAVFDGIKMKGCKICEYFEVIPAIFKAKQQMADRKETGDLIEKYSKWLESNNLWAHFPEHEYTLFDVFYTIQEGLSVSVLDKGSYVNQARLAELRAISKSNKDFDLSKLVRLCEEINICFGNKMYFATGALLRALIDHVPPVFKKKDFPEFANSCGKSIKASMLKLDTSSRKISDSIVHVQIRKSESLPNNTQVDFSQDLDVLLAEICRLLKE